MNSSNLAFDRDYEAEQRKHVAVLVKERNKLLLALEAYESTQEVKIDAKAEKSIKYYRDRLIIADTKLERECSNAKADLEKAEQKYEKQIKALRETHASDTKYCQGELKRLEEGKATPDPERITLMKMRLMKLEASITTKETLIQSFEVVKKPDYIPQFILPEKVWEPSEEALEQERELLKKKKLARLEDESRMRLG